MRGSRLLAKSILAAACFPIVASAQTVVFDENFDAGTGASQFTVHNAGDTDFQVDFNYDYSTFDYLLFPTGGGGEPTVQPIPPAPGGVTTKGVRISVNDNSPGAIVAVQLIPNGINLNGNFRMEFDMWMNYNGPAFGGTGSTETFIAGLNLDGSGVIGPVGTANGYAFSATGEGGATQDYRMVDRGDPIDDGPGYPKVNGSWPSSDNLRYDRTTGDLILSGVATLNDRPHNHFNDYFDEVFPGDAIGGGTFETRGAPGKNWVPVVVEQSDNEILYFLNGKIISTLFRETTAAGVPSLGYVDEFSSLAVPAEHNFILFDNVKITTFNATPKFTATSGNYSTAGNWMGAVPNGAGLKAEFSGAAGPATVNIDVPVTLRAMAFNGANSYTVSGANTITLTGEANSIINNGGNHSVTAPVNSQGHLSVYSAPGTTLSMTDLTTNPNKAFSKAGTGNFEVNEVRAKHLVVTGGTLKLLPGGVSRVNNAQILNATSNIDLTTAPLIVDYTLRTAPGDPSINNSPFNTIYARVLTAFNAGDWQGNGYNSSNAQADPGNYAVGYLDNSAVGLTTYLGEAVDSDTIIVRGTRRGDANLDGLVNLSDFNALAANFGAPNAHWWMGDFNFDTVVDLSDFNALAGNFGMAASVGGPTPEDWAALASAVPEPASLSLLALAAIPLVRRRRR